MELYWQEARDGPVDMLWATSNVLLNRAMIAELGPEIFDPRFGRSGGRWEQSRGSCDQELSTCCHGSLRQGSSLSDPANPRQPVASRSAPLVRDLPLTRSSSPPR